MTNRERMDRIPARLFLLLVAFLIAALSHQPSLKPPFELFPHQDKVFHMCQFGGLALALVLNVDLFGKNRTRRKMLAAGLFWAATDELHQHFVPGRFCSLGDFAADALGLVLGILLFSALIGGMGEVDTVP